MITDVKKPGTPEELVHAGVKGMRWGVRKQRTSSSRPNANQRFKTKFPTREARDREIRRVRAKRYVGKPLTKDEKAIRLRYTTGEKVVLGLLASTGVGTIPIAISLGGVVGVRKYKERQAG